MKTKPTIECDICGIVVAEKETVFFHTKSTFFTIRRDDYCSSYIDDISHTKKSKIHICGDCWKQIEALIGASR
jgi:hypothetical protein